MNKRTRQLLSALASSAFAFAAILPGCSGSDTSTNLSSSGASGLGRGGDSAGAVGRPTGEGGLLTVGANAAAGAGGLFECNGIAPECYGWDLQSCCGNDPYGPAICQGGEWVCSFSQIDPDYSGTSHAAPAPGCGFRPAGCAP